MSGGVSALVTTLTDFRLDAARRRDLTARALADGDGAPPLADLAAGLAPGEAVVAILVEHAWHAGLLAAAAANGGRLIPYQVARQITNTAIDLGRSGRDDVNGWGLVNPRAAVTLRAPADDASEVNDDVKWVRTGQTALDQRGRATITATADRYEDPDDDITGSSWLVAGVNWADPEGDATEGELTAIAECIDAPAGSTAPNTVRHAAALRAAAKLKSRALATKRR